MALTFEKAVLNHRKMWNWIADETLKRECVVSKEDYFRENKIFNINIPLNLCYCCHYTKRTRFSCTACPIKWNPSYENNGIRTYECTYPNSPYTLWKEACRFGDYINAAKYAREIANLPKKKEVKYVNC